MTRLCKYLLLFALLFILLHSKSVLSVGSFSQAGPLYVDPFPDSFVTLGLMFVGFSYTHKIYSQ